MATVAATTAPSTATASMTIDADAEKKRSSNGTKKFILPHRGLSTPIVCIIYAAFVVYKYNTFDTLDLEIDNNDAHTHIHIHISILD